MTEYKPNWQFDESLDLTKPIFEIDFNKYRIDPLEDILPPQTAWSQIGEKEAVLGTLGNFSLIIGKAKSRKSFFINIALSTVLKDDVLLGAFKGGLPHHKRRVLYFDTEQGKYHVQIALKRICKQIGISNPTDLEVYGLRALPPQDRLNFIEALMYQSDNLGFVVIDGIKDLISSINDEAEATMIASKLLKWTEELDIHIVTVLHQNKSDTNARGHIGTELINKAETVLSVTKSDDNKDYSIVEAQYCRNIEPDSIAFEIIDGLPALVPDYLNQIKAKTKRFNPIEDLEDYKKFEIVNTIFLNGESFKYTDLVVQIKLAFQQVLKKSIGDNKAKEFITLCRNNNWIEQLEEKSPYTKGKFKV